MKKGLMVLLTVLLLFATVFAQNNNEWKTVVSNGYSYKYVTGDPMQTRFYTLKNGLTVILSPNHKVPRIAFRMAVRSGSNSDPVNHTGLAHYLEHLLFKGTDKFGSLDWVKEKPLLDKIDGLYEQYISTKDSVQRKEIYKEIDKVSGEAAHFAIAGEYDKLMKYIGSQGTNAHTGNEETVYEEDIPSNTVDQLLTIEAERFRNPVIRLFHTELEAVYEEKNRGLDNDQNKMQEAMFSAIFPTHNYGLQTTIGTIEHLKNPSIIAIREFYQKNYVPNNMAVIMAGDFNPDEVIGKVEKAFAYMQPRPVQEYAGPKQEPIAGPIVKEIFGPSQEDVRILFRIPAAGSREEFLASILVPVLSNGSAGLIDLNLNKQQKVLGAGAGSWQGKDYGIFITGGAPKEGQTLEQVKDLLLQQLNILKKGDFNESLIKAIVANYKRGLLEGLKDNGNRVTGLVDEFTKNKGIGWNKSVAAVDDMGKVTKKELVEFANKFFGDNNYVVIYKRQGVDKNIVKVEKPSITPVETNKDKVSPFVQSIISTPLISFKPVWLDYSKDLQKGKIGNAEVVYVQNKENSLFTLTYNFDMGSWNNKLLPVAAQYLDYLGANKFTSEAISNEFYNLACNFNVEVGKEQTVISISGLQENFDKAVKLFEELIVNCKPDTAALSGLKNLVQKSRSDAKLDKKSITAALQSYASYGVKNPFNFVLSNEELTNLKADDLTNLLQTLTSYKHTITYYGPLSLTVLGNELKGFHKLPAIWKTNDNAIKFERTKQRENQVLFTDYNAVQAEIYWYRNLEKYTPEVEPVVNIFNNYFGGGMGSIVFNVIRESKALAYSTNAYVSAPPKRDDNYAFNAYVGCQSDKMKEAVNGMNELLNEMPKVQQGFDNAKSSLLKDVETQRITGAGIIYTYLAAQRKGLNYDIRKENYKKYNSITFPDILQFHNEQVANKSFTYCVIGSYKKIKMEDIKQYGELKVLKLDALFGY